MFFSRSVLLGVTVMRFEHMQDHRPHPRDVTGAHCEDHISRLRAHSEHLGGETHIVHRLDLIRTVTMRIVHNRVRSHLREIRLLLTRREYAGHNHIVRQ